MALPQGSLSAVGTAIAPGIGTAIGGVLEGLSGLVRGKTQHFSFQQVNPEAEQFSSYMYQYYQTAYGNAGCIAIQKKVRSKFDAALSLWWGRDTEGARAFLNDVPKIDALMVRSPDDSSPLRWFLQVYVLFVMLNVDAERNEEVPKFLATIYDFIFTASISASGLDPRKIGKTSDIVAGSLGGGETLEQMKEGEKTGVGKAGIGTNPIVILALVGAAVALFAGKGKR